MTEIEWHPSTAGNMLHAVNVKVDKTNRNSLCFVMCEREPYPAHVAEKIGKRKKPLKCTRCLIKAQQMGGGS